MAAPAVVVKRAYKYYGKQDKQDFKCVLQYLDMTVEKGIIYGLLGPSGCGKTTLLSCIVGRRKLDSGEVWVLGGKPGEKGSGVPGPRVGYMPQDIALVAEFTVRDAVYYFGRIYGMKMKKLAEQFDFLTNLLELPSGGRLIKSLSGGQQRRVSLAAALVHEPELLILDEPTVGLDPVLRERIWEFLSEQARKGTTVIITTHYIDETKQAHKIGLLRDGQLLDEDTPDEILRRYDCNTLEDAFLKMALRQHEVTHRRRSTLTGSPDVIPESSIVNDSRYQSREDFNVVTSSTDVLTSKEKPERIRNGKKGRYKAVFIKSIQQFSRHPGGLIFSVLFPIVQVVAFFGAIGHDPRDLHVAVVNYEAAFSPLGTDTCNNKSITRVSQREDETCEQYMLSCWFLEEMEKRKLFPTTYNTTEEAKQAVAKRKVYGAVSFTRNFSDALTIRVTEGRVEDDVIDDSTISTWIDMSDHQITNFVKLQLHKAYEAFSRRTMRACGKNEDLVQIPVRFETPVYGTADAEIVAYMAPGVMVTIIFFLAAIITSTLMISDRLEGVWERSAVAGVQPKEMLQVHIAIQSTVILVQTAEMMIVAYLGYNLPSKGSLITIASLLFLQGLGGMCFGFLLSVLCSSYTVSFFIATGSFYPMILLCGILWPIEGMPVFLQYIAFALPFTIPAKSLRDLMEKGSSFINPDIYTGFLITIAWILGTLALCFLRLRYRKM
ncbi:ABC transporter G family member 20-like isoform X1 [Maniola jurtina]|uniref:ABC transporter G family member 20-like isoform X1 n=1 Tax=Maniola jurtina TaxID=191418 RepID=UPI001E685FDF|nr:ABC transporter G family member 20-like isoform X1 [Maniola jurtina]XP_045780635.1 ABC transporter G family member 20-like isoform X1 [Maniola jurtina]